MEGDPVEEEVDLNDSPTQEEEEEETNVEEEETAPPNPLETEILSLKSSLQERESMCRAFESEVSELKRQFAHAKREKESMVMKYAMGEKDVIKIRKAKEDTEKKLKAVHKEKEDLSNKVKAVSGERTRLQQLCDSRQQDIIVARKDVEIWKEEVKCIEAKASLSASRLKAEVDVHRETREQLDITVKHLAETRGEIDGTRRECQEFIQKLKDDERQKKVAVQAKQVKLLIDEAAANELVSFKEKYKSALAENESLKSTILSMEDKEKEMSDSLDQLKETVSSQKCQIEDLLAQVAENEDLKSQIALETEKSSLRSKELEGLKEEVQDLKEGMSACRKKESELLSFTERLTETNVSLVSEHSLLKTTHGALASEHSEHVKSLSSLQEEISSLKSALDEEKRGHREDSEALARKLAEKSKAAEVSQQKNLDLENELVVVKRKNAAKLKELTRELMSVSKKRLEPSSSPVISNSSRASSSTSLNKLNGEESKIIAENGSSYHSSSSNNNNIPDFSTATVPDSQVLIEKIVKLQRNLARKVEKQEFMEEHIETLQKEIKKKNKVIQSYVLHQETGALASSVMDDNKREMLGHGGIMASLYSSTASDSNMTLDLSLEINRKLQAVLEDTLLKNITLKENINTLGNEIANISSIQGKI